MSTLGDLIFDKYENEIAAVVERFVDARGRDNVTIEEVTAVINFCTQTLNMRDVLQFVLDGKLGIDVNEDCQVVFQREDLINQFQIPATLIDETIERILNDDQ